MLKKWLPWALKLGVSGFLIWYLLSAFDVGAAWERAQGIEPGMAALAGGVLCLQIAIGAERWAVVIRAIGAAMHYLKALQILYIGLFFSLVLPSSVGGDAIRMWKARAAGLDLAGAVNSVMLERAATVLGLLALVTATQPLLFSRIGDSPVRWVFPLLTVVGVAGVILLMQLDRLPESLRRWRVVRGLAYLAADTRRVFLSPSNASQALAWSVAGHVNLSITIWLLAQALDVEVSLIDCLVLFPPVILATIIPVSIAGWGVREGAMVTVFGLAGVPADAALLLSIAFGVLNMAMCLPGGLVFLLSGDRRVLTERPDAVDNETAP